MIRTVKSKFRPSYYRLLRNGRQLVATVIEHGKPTRWVHLRCKQGFRDWNGTACINDAAEFMGVADGWQYEGVVYPTLLRAVRQALRDGK